MNIILITASVILITSLTAGIIKYSRLNARQKRRELQAIKDTIRRQSNLFETTY